ncbi:MAG: hypothetical protein K2K26_04475, partial [Muribaculaceae bacterium]|nr:hypothetical protein [Muribaculaceae bacterium]
EYGLDIKESESYHTIGGFILDQLEALPSVGDSFVADGLRFTVLRMSDTRIELVAVAPADEKESDKGQD